MNPLEKKLESIIDNETKNYFVAFSGGVDSTALLNCVNETLKLVDGVSLTALHINHNYSGKS